MLWNSCSFLRTPRGWKTHKIYLHSVSQWIIMCLLLLLDITVHSNLYLVFGRLWGWESSSFYWVKTKLYAREPVCSLSHMKSRVMNSCCLNWFPQTAPICLALGVSILLVALLSSASLSARYVLLLGICRFTSYQSLLFPPIFQPVKGKKSM